MFFCSHGKVISGNQHPLSLYLGLGEGRGGAWMVHNETEQKGKRNNVKFVTLPLFYNNQM